MKNPDWDKFAELGELQAVIDPYDEYGHKNKLIDRIQWNLIQTKLNNTSKLLDFGCGTGRFSKRFQNLGINYTGIDNSENMIRSARELNPSVDFSPFNGKDIPFEDNLFDTCFSCGVLQYILKSNNCSETLAEIFRVLAPGGQLISIEQASQSNQTSGLGMNVLTEADYCSELSNYFDIYRITKVRSSSFSGISNLALKITKIIPIFFVFSLNSIAKYETNRLRGDCNDYLKTVRYYDILIEAKIKK